MKNINLVLSVTLNYETKKGSKEVCHEIDVFLDNVPETYVDVEEVAKLIKQNIKINVKEVKIYSTYED